MKKHRVLGVTLFAFASLLWLVAIGSFERTWIVWLVLVCFLSWVCVKE